jgi:hypothetical protein
MNSIRTVMFNDKFNPISFSQRFSVFPGFAHFCLSPAKVLEPITLYLKRSGKGSPWLKSSNHLVHGESRVLYYVYISSSCADFNRLL